MVSKQGIDNDLLTSILLFYAAEMVVDKNQHGRGVNAMIASATVGTALAYWVDFGMVFATGYSVWRFPIAFQIVFSLPYSSLIWGFPDTPCWYYAKGMVEELDVVLGRLYGLPITDPAMM